MAASGGIQLQNDTTFTGRILSSYAGTSYHTLQNSTNNGTILVLTSTGDSRTLTLQSDHIFSNGAFYLGNNSYATNFRGSSYNFESGNATFAGNVTVTGNLTVNGTTTTLNTQTVEVEDNILQLNTTQGSPDTATAATSGISVYRGDGVTQASLIFDDADDTWDLTNNLTVSNNIRLNNTKNLEFIGNSGDHARIFYTQGDGTTGDIWSHAFYQNSSFQAGIEFFASTEAAGNGNIRFKSGGAEALTLNASQLASFSGDVDVSGNKITMDTIMLQDAAGGRLGFNRDTSNGNIHDSSYNAYQIQNNTGASQGGKLEIQEYNSSGAYAGSTFITGNNLYLNDYVVHNGDDSKIGFEGNDAIRMYTANTVQLQISNNKVGIGTTSPTYKLSVNGAISGAGFVTYTKSYGSLNTTGNAVAGITSGGNGNSAGFTFTCFGGGGTYQRVVYSCFNESGTWRSRKVIDEGTNNLDVAASADGSTITFTFKATSSTQYYTPRVTVEATGHSINSTYA